MKEKQNTYRLVFHNGIKNIIPYLTKNRKVFSRVKYRTGYLPYLRDVCSVLTDDLILEPTLLAPEKLNPALAVL